MIERVRNSPSLLLGGSETGSGVELEEDDVSILHHVRLSLLTVLAGGLHLKRPSMNRFFFPPLPVSRQLLPFRLLSYTYR